MRYDNETTALLEKLVPLRMLLRRVRMAAIEDGAVWIWPVDFEPNVRSYRGLPVIHAEVPHPMLGLEP